MAAQTHSSLGSFFSWHNLCHGLLTWCTDMASCQSACHGTNYARTKDRQAGRDVMRAYTMQISAAFFIFWTYACSITGTHLSKIPNTLCDTLHVQHMIGGIQTVVIHWLQLCYIPQRKPAEPDENNSGPLPTTLVLPQSCCQVQHQRLLSMHQTGLLLVLANLSQWVQHSCRRYRQHHGRQ